MSNELAAELRAKSIVPWAEQLEKGSEEPLRVSARRKSANQSNDFGVF